MKFEGIYTALITPFKTDGFGVDEKIFRGLIERQISAGIHGVIVAGSTGEGQTMNHAEWIQAIKIAVDYKSKIQVLASCGLSSTWETTARYREATELGVHAALVSTPAYNKPPQRGLVQHFQTIAKESKLPIMVYNIPGRTSVNILPSTMQEIWKIPQVFGLKESSGNWEQLMQLMKECPKDKALLSGEDAMNLGAFLSGAHGTVSVLSNIVPKASIQLWNLSKAGKIAEAQKLQLDLMPITQAIFIESNPIPAKWCLSQLLQTDLAPRSPLVALDSSHHAKLKGELDHLRKLGFL